MAGEAELKLKITGDASQAESALKGLSGRVKSAGDATKTAGGGFKTMFSSFLAAGAVQKAAGAIYKFGKESVAAYQAAEQNAVKFNSAMKLLPDSSASTTKALRGQASALSRVTTFSGGQTRAAQAQLAMFKLTGNQIQQLTPLVLDYATKTGQDAPSAAQTLGKALLGQGRALKNIGINFKDAGSVAANFDQVVGGLQGKVGGLATEMGSTAAGKMQIMNNQVGALKVALGEQLVPVITTAANVLMVLVGWIQQNTAVFIPLVSAVLAIITVFKIWAIVNTTLGTSFGVAFWWVVAIIAIIAAVVAIVVICYNRFAWFRAGVQAIWGAIQVYFQVWWAVVRAIFTALVSTVGTVVSAVSGHFGRMAAIVAAYARVMFLPFVVAFQLLRAIVTGNFGQVLSIFASIPGRVASALGGLIGALTAPFRAAIAAVVGIVQAGIDRVKAILAGIGAIASGAINAVKSVYNAFARTWNGIEVSVSVPSNPVTKFLKIAGKGFTLGLPDLPMLASGGYVNKPTLAMIGEGRGGEYVLPEGMLRGLIRAEMGSTATINVYVPESANPAETGRVVANALRSYFSAGGRLRVPA